jgi:hypothetical protein
MMQHGPIKFNRKIQSKQRPQLSFKAAHWLGVKCRCLKMTITNNRSKGVVGMAHFNNGLQLLCGPSPHLASNLARPLYAAEALGPEYGAAAIISYTSYSMPGSFHVSRMR